MIRNIVKNLLFTIFHLPFEFRKNHQFSIINHQSSFGFTLIEIIVVFSIMTILSTAGIAAFVSYSRSEAVNAVAQDIVSMLNTAKSRASSQVKPTASPPCGEAGQGRTLDGYGVVISVSSRNYKLVAVCGGLEYEIPNENKSFPTNIYISTVSDPVRLTFRILTGGVDGALPTTGTAVTVGYDTGINYPKTITVYQDGRIEY